eukprot:6206629-Pleurochrysis_carterae.AAC.2
MAKAARRWQRFLFSWLLEYGFTQCKSDPCVFTLSKSIAGVEQRLILGCHVDDLFTLYSHDGEDSLYGHFTQALIQRWNVEDEGPVSDLLNVDIITSGDYVELKQEKYIAHPVAIYLPDGVPLAFHTTRAPLVEQALLSKPETSRLPVPSRRLAILLDANASRRCLRRRHALPGDELPDRRAPSGRTTRSDVTFPSPLYRPSLRTLRFNVAGILPLRLGHSSFHF